MIDGELVQEFYFHAAHMTNEIELQQDKTGQANRLIFRFVSRLSELFDYYDSFNQLRKDLNLFFQKQDNHLISFQASLIDIFEQEIIACKLPEMIDFSMKVKSAP